MALESMVMVNLVDRYWEMYAEIEGEYEAKNIDAFEFDNALTKLYEDYMCIRILAYTLRRLEII